MEAVLIISHGGADGNLGNGDDREDGDDGGFLSISSGLPGILCDMCVMKTSRHIRVESPDSTDFK